MPQFSLIDLECATLTCNDRGCAFVHYRDWETGFPVTMFPSHDIKKCYPENQLSILDNTSYFPGWTVKVDNTTVPVQFQDVNHRGLLEFSVPSGKHNVVIEFNESKVRLIADIISAFALGILVVLIIFRQRINKLKI